MKSRKKQEAEPKAWRTYEEVAAYLLNRFAKEFGLKFVEGKQKVEGRRSGTSWTIDAKGVAGDEGFFIVECRRYTTSKQNQEKSGGLAYRIIDTGASGGIIVSPFGLQEGAAKVAAAENIISVRLTANSTPTEFAIQFLNKLCLGIRGKATASAIVTPRYLRECLKCGKNSRSRGIDSFATIARIAKVPRHHDATGNNSMAACPRLHRRPAGLGLKSPKVPGT